MILGDKAIRAAMERGSIVVKPLADDAIGSNSVDVRLSEHLAIYPDPTHEDPLDAAHENHIRRLVIPDDGLVLDPGVLYLGSTVEYTECHRDPEYGHLVPDISGKSSVGRLGVCVEVSAGMGDVGFCGYWTLELMAIHSVRVYAGMPIAQIRYSVVLGDVERSYLQKPSAKYQNADPRPQPSRMWKNFPLKPVRDG